MTSASSPLAQLDPNDPEDRKIIARQVRVARAAGREGRDRAGSTRGRADLEAAYDEGAANAAAPAEDVTDEQPAQASAARRGWDKTAGFRQMGPGWESVRPAAPWKPPLHMSDAGGFLAGLALYTVVIIYIRYGPSGWTGWLSAKFLNRPIDSADGSTGSGPKAKSGGKRMV